MISIVLTHFNKGLLLNRTIDSLNFQDDIVHEIIIVDDASTDPNWHENSDYLKKLSPKIKIISNFENKGPAIRLNQGGLSAEGEYLFFMDADDVLAPDRLSLFLNEMKLNHADLCYAKKVKIHDIEEIKKHQHATWEISQTPLRYIVENNIMQMCVMCTRDLFLKSTGCNEKVFIQDESLALNLGKFSKTLISTDLHSVFVILDKDETKSIRGSNRLSRDLAQQHHDHFFTIYDFIQQAPELENHTKTLLIKKAISTYWKSKKSTNSATITDHIIYLYSKINAQYIFNNNKEKIILHFRNLQNIRIIKS